MSLADEREGDGAKGLALPRVASRTRLHETTVAIRRYILEGVPTGTRLKDQELAEALGVSRATVREAVRGLVHEGLLIHEPYKGLRVASLDDTSWLDLAEVRSALEETAVRRLAVGFTPDMDRQLVDALDRLTRARQNGSFAEQNDAHLGFHALLQELSGNRILQQAWDVIETRARVMVRIDLESGPDENRSRSHLAVIEALRTGDPDAAARLMQQHVLGVARQRVQLRRGEVGPDIEG